MMGRRIRAIAMATMLTTAVGSASCGYLLYPERRGTQSGTIDSGTMVMDLLWLLPGIVPGVVALIVDFSSGAIYVRGRTVVRLSTDGHLAVRLPRLSRPTRLEFRVVSSADRILAREVVSVGPSDLQGRSVELRIDDSSQPAAGPATHRGSRLGAPDGRGPMFLEIVRQDGASARLAQSL